MAMRGSKVIVAVLFVAVMLGGAAAAPSLADQCSPKLGSVMTCVGFASGKEASPEKKCCDSVTDMKDTNAACLCFIIQQIHNGTNPVLQKMNIQEARLIQLPSACQLAANASISDCPRLLGLRPNSTEAAIFTSNSTTSPTIGTTSSSITAQGSNGFIHQVPKFTVSILVTISVLLRLVCV